MKIRSLFILTVCFLSYASCDKARRLPDEPDEPKIIYRSFSIYLVDSSTGANLIGHSGAINPDSVYMDFYVDGAFQVAINAEKDSGGQYALSYPYVMTESYEPEKTYLDSRYSARFDIHIPSLNALDTLVLEKTIDSFVHFNYKGHIDTLIPAFPGRSNEKFFMKIRK